MNDADARAALVRHMLGVPARCVPSADTWDEWVWIARMEGAAPLLYHLVDAVPTDLGDDQRAEVRGLQGTVLLRCVELEHQLLEVTAILAAHGIRAVVLKGGATAHLDYPDPSWREVSDVDLLVAAQDRASAVRVLGAEGWTQGYALPRGHEEYTHAVTLVRGTSELDLHQRVAHRALGLRVPANELLAAAVPFRIAGREVLALYEDHRLIHSALHAHTSHGATQKLSSVADVVLAASLRWHRATATIAQAEHWQVRSIVERSLRDCFAIAQLPLPDEWRGAMSRPARCRDRLVDRAYLGEGRRPVTEEIAYLRLLPDWRSRWRYVRGYLATDRDYAEQHGRSGLREQTRYLLAKARSRSRDL